MVQSGAMVTTLRVLLIDDDPAFLRETEAVLTRHRYSVVTADDFHKAAGWLTRYRGRMIVLSELHAAGQSGIGFLKDTLRKYPHVPFTFLASSPPLEAVIEALKRGAYDFLRKPVAPDILSHSVARSVEKLNLSLDTERHERENRESLARNRAKLKAVEDLCEFKSFMISMAAHDFKTLVTVLGSYHQVLQEQCGDCGRPTPAEILAQARRCITRLHRMSGILLDYEAAEKGELRIHPRPFDLDGILVECAAFYRPYAVQKKVNLEIEPPLPPIVTKGDPDRVMEVLDNILYNAVKFTPAEGEIRIGARLESGNVIVWIRDSGIGIPNERLKRLNGRNRLTATKDAGTRMELGLMICRKLLEIQKGTMWIESTPGKGTKVSLSLPV